MALDVATGTVRQDCMPRHRHQKFLTLLKQMERSVPSDLAIHVILDDYAAHKREKVQRWLRRLTGLHSHVTATSASSMEVRRNAHTCNWLAFRSTAQTSPTMS